ncbi:MAG: hypothetical protein ACLGIG_05045 [Actinomycetes bacterium]
MAPDTHASLPGFAASPDDSAMTDRCPQCRGLVRPDAPWCTQCWTDLRPAPPEPRAAEPPAEPVAAPAVEIAAPDTAASAPVKRGLGGWPCTVCQAVNAIELDACTECGSGFLAGVRDAEPALVVPGLGDLARVSRAQRLAVAGGAALLFMVLVALMGLLG